MSSHREAPAISKDPVADNTDTYAFVSPDEPDTVTLITNYVPLEDPAGGPNFYEFGNEDVLYRINIDNDGDAQADVVYEFRFNTRVRNPETFLYNTGPIKSLDDPNWNRRQFYSVTRVSGGRSSVLASDLASPPCNIGPRSTPDYPSLAEKAVHIIDGGIQVFAGQRREGFYVDLGAIFDLADLRPFQSLHAIHPPDRPSGLPEATKDAPGVNSTKDVNVHTIAIRVPIRQLTRDGTRPTDPLDPKSVIGVWGSASRRKSRVRDGEGDHEAEAGPWVQVSRLANPLFNEVIVPMGRKDRWNSLPPSRDAEFLKYVQHPELAGLLPVLYPGVFPNLASYTAERADLVAILLTGLPRGVIKDPATGKDIFQNFTGKTYADMLRLNVAIPPNTKDRGPTATNVLGILGGDLAGFPNGRRVFDDTVTIELRAIAGLTIPLVDSTFKPDAAAGLVSDFVYPMTRPPSLPVQIPEILTRLYQSNFPYLGVPLAGFDVPSQ
jgi:hypothetical protein